MPKADNNNKSSRGRSNNGHRSACIQQRQHDPLGQQIVRDDEAGRYAATSKKASRAGSESKRRDDQDDDDDDDNYGNNNGNGNVLDSKASQRILDMSRQQRLEEEGRGVEGVPTRRRKQGHSTSRSDVNDDDSGEDSSVEEVEEDGDNDNDNAWGVRVRHDDQGYVSVVGIMDPSNNDHNDAAMAEMSKEDLDLIHSMMNPTAERRTLADLILEKIDERQKDLSQQQISSSNNNAHDDDPTSQQLPPKVVHVYTEIGKMLSRYTAGKLPKAFKVIPSLSNWQDILWLTRPDLWTPQAMYAATRIFASNLNPKMAQQFYQLVLLDAVRNDIYMNKKLNYHYYMALKKSIYKPAAFFKGILFPLVQPDADATLREAIIVASVLQRVSIPVHHAAVAIHKLAQASATTTPSAFSTTVLYNGPVSIFLKVLLNKKYSLPAPVIDGVVAYFGSFLGETRVPGGHDNVLPVLWHQALLVFVQRYKDEIRTGPDAMKTLKLVMKKHFHPKLTPEIRRELLGGQQAWKEQQEQHQKQAADEGVVATTTATTAMVVD